MGLASKSRVGELTGGRDILLLHWGYSAHILDPEDDTRNAAHTRMTILILTLDCQRGHGLVVS